MAARASHSTLSPSPGSLTLLLELLLFNSQPAAMPDNTTGAAEAGSVAAKSQSLSPEERPTPPRRRTQLRAGQPGLRRNGLMGMGRTTRWTRRRAGHPRWTRRRSRSSTLSPCPLTTVTSGDTPYTSARTFEDLNLSPELLKGLYVEMKFSKPSKIQAISLPMILTPPYKNLIAQAQNGSGKTTGFVLGMLNYVDPNLKAPQALCICPTRELAIQHLEVLLKMGKYN
ncbi:hypothetical protein CRG98_021977 [Punica granatum]|uniref:ATP-dependent RNA helicase n=1 Tax=Punica granatum TaxID=22663 RepID=A0A2I0JMZ8_PUNGR|nr:hypothetical protein CRG98_021977 [Punica granatum]